MTHSAGRTSLRTAALIAGAVLLIMSIAAPFAELFVYPKLVVPDNAAETVRNISTNRMLFVSAIFAYLTTFLCDVVAAWALYVLLKPVQESLSILTAWFRLVYTVIAIAALLNLLNVLRLLDNANHLTPLLPDQLPAFIMLSLKAFRGDFHFALVFFGVHLALLGYLVLKSHYIPGVLGILLIIAGLGYFLTSVRPYLFPDVNLDFAEYTFYGELIFMLWLLIRGPRIQEPA